MPYNKTRLPLTSSYSAVVGEVMHDYICICVSVWNYVYVGIIMISNRTVKTCTGNLICQQCMMLMSHDLVRHHVYELPFATEESEFEDDMGTGNFIKISAKILGP